MVILLIDFNNISLDKNFDEDDPNTIIFIRLLVWHIKFEKHKPFKKQLNEELMPVELGHVRRWEKRNRSNFYWRFIKCASVVYNCGVSKYFAS